MRLLLPLIATAVAAPLCAQRVPELEPNDLPTQAQTLAAGQHVEAFLTPGEQDWFAFTLAAAGQVHVRTSGNFLVNSSVDTFVAIYDATGTTRLAWDDNSAGVHSDCGATLPAGSYTVLVMGKLATTTNDYGIDFVVLPVTPVDTLEGPEPNDNPSAGGTPTPITLGDTIEGELTATTDSDWYSFTLTGRAIVQGICYDDGGVPQLDNTRLQFWQETAPGVWSAFGTSSFISTSHRAFNLAHPQTLAAGSYAIEVSSATSTATGTAPWDYQKVGKYSLRTRLIDMSGGVQFAENPEPNDSPTTATFMVLGEQAVGFITGQNEGDWYEVFVPSVMTIGAMSADFGATPITDTTVRLRDAAGNTVATASSGGASSHGKLIYTVTQPGTYYLEVAGGLFAATGDYVLYTGAVDAMFVASGSTVQPASVNACPGSNTLRPLLGNANGESPFLGSSYVARVDRALPNTIVVGIFGTSNTTALGGAIALPFDLTPLGAPGCFVRVDPLVTVGAFADGAGTAFFDFPLGPNLSARGTTVFVQALCLDIPLNPLGLSVSNDMKLVVGDRSF